MSNLEERDWKQLLPELIHLIAKKLPDVLNFIRFRSVCKTWQFSAPLSDPPTQFPWFYEYPESNSDSDGDDARDKCSLEGLTRFYSISSTETLTINVRAPCVDRNMTRDLLICCHNVPFIHLTVDFAHCVDMYFYNPLTKKQFALERVPLPLYRPVIAWTDTNSLCNRSMLIVDSDLKHTRNLEERAGLAFFDPHCQSWIVHKGTFSNAFLCQGIVFMTEANGYTMIWDLNTKMLSHKIPPPENEIKTLWDDKKIRLGRLQKQRTYIVESGGIILRVSWIYDMLQENAEGSTFHIYKLQFDGVTGKPCWDRLNNIGNQVLFLEEKIAFSMTARPSTGFKEGCIYFFSPFYQKPCVYDVLAGIIERVPVPSSLKVCTWFVPGLC